jgi:hypothetical protein
MQAPVLVKAIAPQVVNERASYGPFFLFDYIQAPDSDKLLNFSAQLGSGAALPAGLVCLAEGVLVGIPAEGTTGHYDIIVTGSNEAGECEASISFTIKEGFATPVDTEIDKRKAEIWNALDKNLQLPEFAQLAAHEITALDIYYLLERYGVLIIWNANDLNPAADKKAIQLAGASEHYHVYDRGSSFIAAPKDLYTHERTLLDGLKTAQAMATELYKRNWTIEMAGYDKFTRAVWVEYQRLEDMHGKNLKVMHYSPSSNDLRLYQSQSQDNTLSKGM